MKLCIPTLGAIIRLTEDWEFRLYFESRNATVLAALFDGSKKMAIPWSRYFEDINSPPPHPNVGDWWRKGVADAKKLMADFKKAGYTVHYRKTEYSEEAADSYKSQVQLPYIMATLPAGTVLAFDRYYIRQGAEAFDSVTFKIEKCPEPKFTMAGKVCRRFWARLQDVNNIECDFLG